MKIVKAVPDPFASIAAVAGIMTVKRIAAICEAAITAHDVHAYEVALDAIESAMTHHNDIRHLGAACRLARRVTKSGNIPVKDSKVAYKRKAK